MKGYLKQSVDQLFKILKIAEKMSELQVAPSSHTYRKCLHLVRSDLRLSIHMITESIEIKNMCGKFDIKLKLGNWFLKSSNSNNKDLKSVESWAVQLLSVASSKICIIQCCINREQYI